MDDTHAWFKTDISRSFTLFESTHGHKPNLTRTFEVESVCVKDSDRQECYLSPSLVVSNRERERENVPTTG